MKTNNFCFFLKLDLWFTPHGAPQNLASIVILNLKSIFITLTKTCIELVNPEQSPLFLP